MAVFAGAIVLYTFSWNIVILNERMYDTHSYDANGGNWLDLLKVNDLHSSAHLGFFNEKPLIEPPENEP